MPKGYPAGLFPAQSCPAAFCLPQGGPSPTNLSQPATNHTDLASPGPSCACMSCNAMPKGYPAGLFPAQSCPSAQNSPLGVPAPPTLHTLLPTTLIWLHLTPCACVNCNPVPKGYPAGLFPAQSCPVVAPFLLVALYAVWAIAYRVSAVVFLLRGLWLMLPMVVVALMTIVVMVYCITASRRACYLFGVTFSVLFLAMFLTNKYQHRMIHHSLIVSGGGWGRIGRPVG